MSAPALFGFDYRLECYTPAGKRQYGYFMLPVLRRGQLAGRIDAKAHRAAGVFELKSVVLEGSARPSGACCATWPRRRRCVPSCPIPRPSRPEYAPAGQFVTDQA